MLGRGKLRAASGKAAQTWVIARPTLKNLEILKDMVREVCQAGLLCVQSCC